MIGTIASSSMSSSAREVRFGSPPGIGLLMKWMTCAFTAGLPAVGGGCRVCACASAGRCATRCASRCAWSPSRSSPSCAALIVAGSVALRKNIVAAAPGLNSACPRCAAGCASRSRRRRNRCRPGTGSCTCGRPCNGRRHRRTRRSGEAHAAARLLLVEEGLDQKRGREDLVARRVEEVRARHVRRADRLAFAAAQAVLDRVGDRRRSRTLSRIRLSWPISEKLGVYALRQVASRPRSSLPALKRPCGIDAALVGGERRELVVGEVFELGDADPVLAGDDAVERSRERHDPRDRRVGRLQHRVIVGVDGDVGVHVAVAGVHVQRDEHAAAQHVARGSRRSAPAPARTRARRRSRASGARSSDFHDTTTRAVLQRGKRRVDAVEEILPPRAHVGDERARFVDLRGERSSGAGRASSVRRPQRGRAAAREERARARRRARACCAIDSSMLIRSMPSV